MSTLVHSIRAAAVRRRRWIAALLGVLAAYAAAGFLLVPYVLERKLPERLSGAIGRKVVVERIRLNPFTLSIQVDGFSVLDVDGRTPALSWRSLFVNYELWPVLKHEQRFQVIRLVQPAVRTGLRRDGAATFADVLERLRGPDVAAKPARADEKPARPWTIAVGRLDIDEAVVQFRDVSRAAPFESTFGPVTFHVESVRTSSDGRSPFTISGRTEAGEAFSWTGTFQLAPVRSAGTLVLEDVSLPKYAPYYSDVLLARLRQGRATMRATYDLNLGPDRAVRLLDGELRVRGVSIHERAGDARILSLPELDVTGVRADLLASSARVDRVEARGGVLSVRRGGDGAVNLAGIVAPTPRRERQPFRYEIGAVALHGWRVEVSDRLPPRPVELALGDVELALGEVRSEPGAESPLTASLAWPGGGKLRVEGTVAPSRPAATLTVGAEGLSLVPLDPYAALYGGMRGRIAEGSVRGELRAAIDLASPGATSYAVTGQAAVDGLGLLDASAEEVVRWKTLEATGIDVRSSPAGVQLGVLRLVEPRLQVVRLPDATTNLAGLSAPPEPATADATATAPPPRGARAAARAPEPTPFRIGTIAVERGRATVVDRSVKPAAVLRYTGLRARITGFASDAKARAGVDVEALVEGAAPFRVAGTLNPRLVGDVTDLTVRSQGIDLTPFGPYARRYAGYALERGKMDLDLRYRVKQRNLASTNVVRIDGLAFGEKTDSPDAPSFPMGLALAVLTDRNGVMLLDVPVDGNIDDPEFKLGRVIWRAVLNVLGKVATAPFTAIAALVGGGGDAKLDVVDFAAGSARLDAASLAKLDQLAKALHERPQLKLEVAGEVDGSTDRAALGRQALRRLAAEEMRRSSPKGREAQPAPLAVSDEEYPRYLRLAYEAALQARPQVVPAAAGVPVAPAAPRAPTPEEMEALLLERVDLDAAQRTLASERAGAVREGLLERQVDQSRLFLSEDGGGKDASRPSVRLKLR